MYNNINKKKMNKKLHTRHRGAAAAQKHNNNNY